MNSKNGLFLASIIASTIAVFLLSPYVVTTTQGIGSSQNNLQTLSGQYESAIDIDEFTGDAMPMLENSNTYNLP